MSLFRKKNTGIVNVRMVITEEKILSNIDKVNPSDPQFIKVAKNYMISSQYSHINIGHCEYIKCSYCPIKFKKSN